MKSSILFICVVLTVEVFGFDWEPNDLECLKELNIEKVLIDSFPDPLKKATAEDNKVYNDFTECSWKKDGLLDQNGHVQWEVFYKIIEEELKEQTEKDKSDSDEQLVAALAEDFFKSLLNDCRTIKGDTPGQVAVKTQNCIGSKLRSIPNSSSDESK